MKVVWSVLIIVVVLAAAPRVFSDEQIGEASSDVTTQPKSQVDEILTNVQKRLDDTNDLQANFTLVEYDEIFEKEREKSGVIFFKKPGMFRMEYEKPYEKLWLVNKERVLEYIPSNRIATIIKLDEEQNEPEGSVIPGFADSPEKLKKDYNVTLSDTVEIDKTKYYVIELTPNIEEENTSEESSSDEKAPATDTPQEAKQYQYKSILWWIADETWLPYQIKLVEENKTYTFTFSDIQVNQSISDTLFENPEFPDDVTVEYH